MLPVITIKQEFIDHARLMLEHDVFGVAESRLQSSANTNRSTHSFGYDFERLKQRDQTFTEIPDYLSALCHEAVQQLQLLTSLPLPSSQEFRNCIISIYNGGDRLQSHIDTDVTNAKKKGSSFYFGCDIIGVVLEADLEGRFYVIPATTNQELKSNRFQPQFVDEIDGSAFLVSGQNRQYFHGVSPVRNRRISATFRTVHFC